MIEMPSARQCAIFRLCFVPAMRPLDRTQMARKYAGQWIALKADRKTVVGSGGTAEEALEAARKLGYTVPVITRMPRHLLPRA
jgi:Family of unknown function (DUF5678)